MIQKTEVIFGKKGWSQNLFLDNNKICQEIQIIMIIIISKISLFLEIMPRDHDGNKNKWGSNNKKITAVIATLKLW